MIPGPPRGRQNPPDSILALQLGPDAPRAARRQIRSGRKTCPNLLSASRGRPAPPLSVLRAPNHLPVAAGERQFRDALIVRGVAVAGDLPAGGRKRFFPVLY